ncbi:hypothetical protein AB1388_43335, partial [Streptomyces hydrogenans]
EGGAVGEPEALGVGPGPSPCGPAVTSGTVGAGEEGAVVAGRPVGAAPVPVPVPDPAPEPVPVPVPPEPRPGT